MHRFKKLQKTIIASFIFLLAFSMFLPIGFSLENYNTYTEVDPNNRISIYSASEVNVTNLSRNEDAYLYKDYGIGAFGDTFTHYVDVQPLTGSATGGVGAFYGLANSVDDLYYLQNNEPCVFMYFNPTIGGSYRIVLLSRDSSGVVNNTYYANYAAGSWYYITIVRNPGYVKAEIYSDSARTNLITTLNVSMDGTSFRYLYAVDSYNNGYYYKVSYNVANLDVGATISISNVYPADASIALPKPTCNVTVNSSAGYLMNISWYENTTGSWVLRQTNSSVTNGTYSWVFSQANQLNTTYWWKIVINDGVNNVSWVFSFSTTEDVIPSNFSIVAYNSTHVNITWVKGLYAVNTVILRNNNTDVYPTLSSFDVLVYNGSGTQVYDQIQPNTRYVYTAYGYVNGAYSTPVYITWGFMEINCFDEIDNNEISNWNLYITNENGSQTFTADNVSNPYTVSFSQLPTGDNVLIQVNKSGYASRVFYQNIPSVQNMRKLLYLYLLPVSSSQLFLIQVVNVYDNPVPDAQVAIKRLINNSYETVTNVFTSGDGTVGVYLQPDVVYLRVVSKTGFNTSIDFFIPVSSISVYTVKLYFSVPSAVPFENVLTNISYMLTPMERYHNDSIPFNFTIASLDNQLEWYNMSVFFFNTSADDWVRLFYQNSSNPGGGFINYTTSNTTGEYRVVLLFKKMNYSVFYIGGGYGLVYYIYRESGVVVTRGLIEQIPDFVWLLITIFFMVFIMGFLYPYAGVMSGFVGLGVMGFMFALKPGLVVAGISGWYIFLITVLVFLAVAMIRGRV